MNKITPATVRAAKQLHSPHDGSGYPFPSQSFDNSERDDKISKI